MAAGCVRAECRISGGLCECPISDEIRPDPAGGHRECPIPNEIRRPPCLRNGAEGAVEPGLAAAESSASLLEAEAYAPCMRPCKGIPDPTLRDLRGVLTA